MTTVDDTVASLPLQELAECLDLSDVANRHALQNMLDDLLGGG